MKKNIVFILSDQHNANIIGDAGDPHIRTPNLDCLAASGVSFENCYCASPLCVPSRAAMLSGLLPAQTGIFTNFQSLPSDRATFVHSLAIAGYETVLCGRMHYVGADQRHGFSKRLVGDFCPTVVGGGIELGYLNNTPDQSKIALEKSGPGNSGVIDYDKAVVREALSYLQNREPGKPLFLIVGLYGPHCPYVCPEELFDYYYRSLPLPASIESFKENVHPAVKKWFGNRGLLHVSTEEIRRSKAAYYGLIELMDGFIGAIVEQVKKTMRIDDTLIIYASDHGDMIGDKGLFWKSNFYEGSAKVPLIFSLPGEIPEGRKIRENTSLLDLGPTLIDFCAGPELPRADGISVLELLKGEESKNENRAIISQLGDVKGDSPSAMIRYGNWKLISHLGYEYPQLFDLKKDPAEVNDLAQNPSYLAICRELQDMLDDYWDGEAVSRHIKDSYAHTQLLRRWQSIEQPDDEEQWVGDSNNNYLIT